MRKVLVVGQFTISITLIITTFIVYKQITFMKEQPLGFDKEQIYVVPVKGEKNYNILKNAIINHPDIISIGGSRHSMWRSWRNRDIEIGEMKTRVAINGFGRIGRNVFKILEERADVEVVAINDLTDNETLAHLLRYDTNYGAYDKEVKSTEEDITVAGHKVEVFSEKDPSALPWGEHDIDVVGFFMFGFPSETMEDIQMTVDFMKELDPVIAHCNLATPDPGTERLDMLQKSNSIDLGSLVWSDFYHQNPKMFLNDGFDALQKEEFIEGLQRLFDKHNKRHYRMDILRRFPF